MNNLERKHIKDLLIENLLNKNNKFNFFVFEILT